MEYHKNKIVNKGVKEILQVEILDLWTKAVAYFNSVCRMVEHLPTQEEANFPSLARRSALSIPDNIAKSSICVTAKEQKESLNQAIESVASTVSTLQIANQCSGLRRDLVRQAYREGELIVRRIKHISQLSNLN